MNLSTRLCRQCGELKADSEFRNYYSGRKGKYKVCKACEKINYRVKYLTSLARQLTEAEQNELNKIYALWDAQRSMGLEPPNWNVKQETPVDEIENKLAELNDKVLQLPDNVIKSLSATTPHVTEPRTKLYHWATVDIRPGTDPDHLVDNVYFKLRTTYMPQISIDSRTFVPVFDTTYKPVLDYILDRFCQYEDLYYKQEDDVNEKISS